MTCSNEMLIAEIAQAHDGSNGILHSFIDAISTTGVTHIKFQMHIAEAESSLHENFRVKFSRVDATRFDYWKRMEFTYSQWEDIYAHCQSVGVGFLCTPFSLKAVEWLEKLGVDEYKVGSGDINNYALLKAIAATRKHIILSSGMSNYMEIDKAVDIVKSGGSQVSVLQCTTEYPTSPKSIGLNVISELRARYDCPVGLSDHSGTVYPSFAAAALGADIFEVHTCFHKKMFGPDTAASLTVDELVNWAAGLRYIFDMRNNSVNKENIDNYHNLREIFGRSLAVNKQLSSGHVIQLEDLESKKPSGYGIAANEVEKVLGRRLMVNKNQWDFLNYGDLHE